MTQPAHRRLLDVALTASARRIDLASAEERDRARKARQRSDWQQTAWSYYDTLGEVWFAHRFVGNAISRVRLHVAWQPNPGQPPVLLDPDDPDLSPEMQAVAASSAAELLRLDSNPAGGISGMMRDLATNIALVGEAHLLGETALDEDSLDGEVWRVCSNDELRADDRGWLYVDTPGTEGRRIDPATSTMIRVWRRHPRWADWPDSPMRAAAGICEELQYLTQAMRGSSLSRLHAGLLAVPDELTFPALDTDPDYGQGADDPFTMALMTAMLAPISDPESAASVVPLMVRGPAEALKELRRLDLSRPIDAVQAAQRDELIGRLATAIDLPPEVLRGMTDANHWTAWQIDEQTFRAHLEPLVLVIVQGLTVGYLRPMLAAQGLDPRAALVWYDESELTGQGNDFEQARVMHDKYVVSDAYLRRRGGAADDDAPDDDELARRIATQSGLGVDVVATLLEQTGLLPPNTLADTVAIVDQPGAAPPSTPPAGGTPPGAPPETTGPPPLVAAAARTSIGRELVEIDRMLRVRLQQAADDAVRRMLDRAGAKLRRRLQADKPLAASMKQVPNERLAAALGRDRVLSLGVEEQALIDRELGSLQSTYRQLTRRAYRQADRVMVRYGYEPTWDDASLQARADESIDKGWLILAAGVAGLATSLLFAPSLAAPVPDGVAGVGTLPDGTPAPPGVTLPAAGEWDDTTLVQAGLVRESLAVAGGAPAEAATGTESFAGPEGRPSGGIATGDLLLGAWADAIGIMPTGWRWLYGDPAARRTPFEPHEALDLVEFATWSDDVLANPDGWPDGDYYRPGDHLGCLCDFEPIFGAADGTDTTTDAASAADEEG